MHHCQTLTQILMDESTFEFYKETAAVVWRKMVSSLQTFFFRVTSCLVVLIFFNNFWLLLEQQRRHTMLVQFEPKILIEKIRMRRQNARNSSPSKSYMLSNHLRHVHFWNNLQKCDIPSFKRKRRRYLSMMQQFFIFQHLFILPHLRLKMDAACRWNHHHHENRRKKYIYM